MAAGPWRPVAGAGLVLADAVFYFWLIKVLETGETWDSGMCVDFNFKRER